MSTNILHYAFCMFYQGGTTIGQSLKLTCFLSQNCHFLCGKNMQIVQETLNGIKILGRVVSLRIKTVKILFLINNTNPAWFT